MGQNYKLKVKRIFHLTQNTFLIENVFYFDTMDYVIIIIIISYYCFIMSSETQPITKGR